MLTMFFGEHKEPCSDCTQIGGKAERRTTHEVR